jgi:hypothetical protein
MREVGLTPKDGVDVWDCNARPSARANRYFLFDPANSLLEAAGGMAGSGARVFSEVKGRVQVLGHVCVCPVGSSRRFPTAQICQLPPPSALDCVLVASHFPRFCHCFPIHYFCIFNSTYTWAGALGSIQCRPTL